jgi:Rad3-related DNA helicase
VIDEGDEFLDQFLVEGSLHLPMVLNELKFLPIIDSHQRELVEELQVLVLEAMQSLPSFLNKNHESILPLKETPLFPIVKLLCRGEFSYITDDESYLERCFELCRKFNGLFDDTYAYISKEQDGKKEIITRLITLNLQKAVQSLAERNNALVFMSGTLHDPLVLQELFGIHDLNIVEAETNLQGRLTKIYTGLEAEFTFENMRNGKYSREQYLHALQACILRGEKPMVVHITAFYDLPTFDEKKKFNLHALITQEELKDEQENDSEGNIVQAFKRGEKEILFTTRCNRGIDFPMSICNSIVITRFPYPPLEGLFWKVLKKQKPGLFWHVYKDKAHRDLLQKIYRSIRSKDDHVYLLSPDSRVLNVEIV